LKIFNDEPDHFNRIERRSFMSRHAHGADQKHRHQPRPQPAQSALESNWGRTVKDNAYFGIKGKSATGKSTSFSTHEVRLSGQRVSEIDEFRAYSSYAEAADDYASLIQQRYSVAFAYRNDPEKFAEAVARQGYATDPQYAAKLKSIIHSHITPLLLKYH
jgi:flagellum-specific peptidoglycan hydrolase FlgJ